MSVEGNAEELEKEIILMEQELILKRELLEECRNKLNSEISDHMEAKLTAHKYLNENKELQIRLEVCLKGTQVLEEENTKNRELLVKLQAQMDAYLAERQQLSDACFEAEKEKAQLKNEVADLKQQLKEREMLLEYFKQMKPKTEALLSEIMSKQEILNKEQTRLEAVCKEGMKFAERLSEENKFQARFVQEAKIGQAKMENEMIRLMAAISELRTEKENNTKQPITMENSNNYLDLWKSHQKEMKIRNEELQTINKRLNDELSFIKDQVEILLKNY